MTHKSGSVRGLGEQSPEPTRHAAVESAVQAAATSPIHRHSLIHRITRSQPAFGLRRQPELCRQAAEVDALTALQ